MKKPERFYIDIHVLQTVPPSCVNRDDTGSPKTAVYGGVTRARVSSQAWKRAVRLAFREILTPDQVGTRTKKLLDQVTDTVLARDPSLNREKAEKAAEKALEKAGFSLKKAGELDVLYFISEAQTRALAELALHREEDKNAYKTALKENPSVDQVLFGRMVADDRSLNYDAAAQVAHSISTHAVQNEFDYFTAVDDRAPEDNAGAAHIGTAEFNSATLYRYATVNVSELAEWLAGDTPNAVKGFVEAFCRSMPDGKQNSFANRTLPDAVYVAVRNDQPVNLAGAFEKPVRTGFDGGCFAASERALANYAKQTYELFATEPVLSLCVSRGEALAGIAEAMNLPGMLERVGDYVAERLAAGGAGT